MVTATQTSNGTSQPSQLDLDRFKQIHEKQAQGKTLTDQEREVVGRVANAVIDTVEINANESLRNVLRKYLVNGELNAKEQAQLQEALGEIPELKKNKPLESHLRAIRAKGYATDAEVEQIKKLTGKLSDAEDTAIYNTLAAIALTQGVSEKSAKSISEWLDRGRIERAKYGMRQNVVGTLKRIGLVALAIVGLSLAFAAAPIGAGAAIMALKTGVLFGSAFGAIKAGEKWGNVNRRNAANYGVEN